MQYLDQNISLDGRLSIPVLTMHTTGDGLVIPPHESAYAAVVGAAGDSSMLRQTFVHRAGHCAFTDAETIAAAQVLLKRLDTGRWDDAALTPAALNAAAQAQGDSRTFSSVHRRRRRLSISHQRRIPAPSRRARRCQHRIDAMVKFKGKS